MASLAAVNSFSGLKVQSLKVSGVRSASSSARPATVVCSAGSPWEKIGKALVATGAGLLIATSANAVTSIQLGDDSGALVFKPDTITVKVGEEITFTNNKGFPHNVVFDEDLVPAGVNVDTISKPDLLNALGDKYKITLTVPGKYRVYCEPHEGAGMEGTIIVE